MNNGGEKKEKPVLAVYKLVREMSICPPNLLPTLNLSFSNILEPAELSRTEERILTQPPHCLDWMTGTHG